MYCIYPTCLCPQLFLIQLKLHLHYSYFYNPKTSPVYKVWLFMDDTNEPCGLVCDSNLLFHFLNTVLSLLTLTFSRSFSIILNALPGCFPWHPWTPCDWPHSQCCPKYRNGVFGHRSLLLTLHPYSDLEGCVWLYMIDDKHYENS